MSDLDHPVLRLIKAESSLHEKKSEASQVVLKQTEIHQIQYMKFNQYSDFGISFG